VFVVYILSPHDTAQRGVVFFGAGASHGCSNVDPYPPPLGSDLFKELTNDFPLTWGKLPTSFRDGFSRGFEIGMEKIIHSNRFPELGPRLMRDMAKYFIKFRPLNDSNLYVQFLSRVKPFNKEYTFSTINYDVLFEYAAAQNGLAIDCFPQIQGDLFYLKLHGSSNFILAVRGLKVINTRYNRTTPLLETPLRTANPEEVLSFCNSVTSLYPAMCLYAPEKKAQIGYERILKLREIWKERIMNVDRILTIGFRPWKPDMHIYEPISNTPARVGFVGSRLCFEGWINPDRDTTKTEFLGETWQDSFEACFEFLKSSNFT
jgi:hypothetical protein